jgi:hypothetical protein
MNETKRLSPSEIRKIKDFVTRYSELNEKVIKMEGLLSEIDKNKDNLLGEIKNLDQEINQVRLEEDSFRSMLLTKYGQFSLDFETFEIKNT